MKPYFSASLSARFHLPLLPLLHPDDGFGTGGADGGQGGQPGGGAPQGGGGQRGAGRDGGAPRTAGGQRTDGNVAPPGGGTPGSDAYEFSDTGRYRLNDGRVVTGAQLKEEMGRELDGQYRTRYQRGYDLLVAEARRLDALRQSGQGQGGRQPQGQGQDDPFADIWNAPVLDGAAAKRLVTALQQAGLAPLAGQIQALVKQVTEQQKQLQQFGQRFGSADEDQESKQFESRLDQTLSSLEIKGLNGKLDPKQEWIREIARDHFLSYVPSSWRAGEYEASLAKHIERAILGVRELDRSLAQQGRDTLRKNFNPARGNAAPGGNAKPTFKTGREIAAMARDAGMFSGAQT